MAGGRSLREETQEVQQIWDVKMTIYLKSDDVELSVRHPEDIKKAAQYVILENLNFRW